jgi:hypothetical protein
MARTHHPDAVTYSAYCSAVSAHDDNDVGYNALTCRGCLPTTRLQFLREVAFSWPLWTVRRLRTTLPSSQG